MINEEVVMRECPRFEVCSINKCPLHPGFKELEDFPCDPSSEQSCTDKAIIERIRLKYKMQGIVKRTRRKPCRWTIILGKKS